MILKNVEVEFDFLDADDIEKFELEAKKVIEICEKEENNTLSASENLRKQCKVINEFFDNVFGEGVSKKIFKGKNNLKEHLELFEEIIKEKYKEENQIKSKFNRYQPNRDMRRNNKFRGAK